MRAAKGHRYTESLHRPHGDVRAEGSRRFQQRESERICIDDHQRALILGLRDQAAWIGDTARGGRVRDHHSGQRTLRQAVQWIEVDDLNALGLSARAHHGTGLWVHSPVDRDAIHALRSVLDRHRHRFGNRGGLVQQRSTRNAQAGEVLDQGLEVQQCLESALGDFGLVGRVGGVPSGIQQDAAFDGLRHHGSVVTQTDHVRGALDALDALLKFGKCFRFARGRWQGRHAEVLDTGGHHRVNERFEIGVPEFSQHRIDVGGTGADVTGGEIHSVSRQVGRTVGTAPPLLPALGAT